MNHRSQSENLGFRPKNINLNKAETAINNDNINNAGPSICVPSQIKTTTELIQNALNDNKKLPNKKFISLKNFFRTKNDEELKEINELKEDDIIFTFNDDLPRETWSKRLDFLMSIIGFSVDIAGIWRLFVHFLNDLV
jgi:hypothetical protein